MRAGENGALHESNRSDVYQHPLKEGAYSDKHAEALSNRGVREVESEELEAEEQTDPILLS